MGGESVYGAPRQTHTLPKPFSQDTVMLQHQKLHYDLAAPTQSIHTHLKRHYVIGDPKKTCFSGILLTETRLELI